MLNPCSAILYATRGKSLMFFQNIELSSAMISSFGNYIRFVRFIPFISFQLVYSWSWRSLLRQFVTLMQLCRFVVNFPVTLSFWDHLIFSRQLIKIWIQTSNCVTSNMNMTCKAKFVPTYLMPVSSNQGTVSLRRSTLTQQKGTKSGEWQELCWASGRKRQRIFM